MLSYPSRLVFRCGFDCCKNHVEDPKRSRSDSKFRLKSTVQSGIEASVISRVLPWMLVVPVRPHCAWFVLYLS